MIRRHGLFFWISIALTLLAVAGLLWAYFNVDFSEVDTVEINRVRTELNLGRIPENPRYDYTAVLYDGSVLYSTTGDTEPTGYSERVNDAVRRGCTAVDFDGGKIIFETNVESRISETRDEMFFTALALIIAIFLIFLIEILYLDRRVFRPFRALERFSKELSKGNFNTPLLMDRGNNFGAFTEAFDLMRQNLLDAEREKDEALQSKRVLMAELGHDIRTPLSSILAVAELKKAQGVEGMETIVAKARQIDSLFSDIYNVSLKDVNRLRVEPKRCPSSEILKIIKTCDAAGAAGYKNDPPDREVYLDKLRFEECCDNVLLNARKYADGAVDVEFGQQDGYVWVSFKDYGEGVAPEELAFVTDKFFRGETARNKTGEGLGLYVTRNLIEKMGGKMRVENAEGLKITFFLPTEPPESF